MKTSMSEDGPVEHHFITYEMGPPVRKKDGRSRNAQVQRDSGPEAVARAMDNSEHEFQEAFVERDVTRAMRILRDAAEDLLQAK